MLIPYYLRPTVCNKHWHSRHGFRSKGWMRNRKGQLKNVYENTRYPCDNCSDAGVSCNVYEVSKTEDNQLLFLRCRYCEKSIKTPCSLSTHGGMAQKIEDGHLVLVPRTVLNAPATQGQETESASPLTDIGASEEPSSAALLDEAPGASSPDPTAQASVPSTAEEVAAEEQYKFSIEDLEEITPVQDDGRSVDADVANEYDPTFEFVAFPAEPDPAHDLVSGQTLEIARLKRELEEAKKSNEDREAQLKQDYNANLRRVEEEREAAKKGITERDAKLEQLQNAYNDTRDKLEQAEKDLEDLDAEIGRYEQVCGEQGMKIDELEEELAECKSKLRRSAETHPGVTKRRRTRLEASEERRSSHSEAWSVAIA